jgi:hypothetical protein
VNAMGSPNPNSIQEQGYGRGSSTYIPCPAVSSLIYDL